MYKFNKIVNDEGDLQKVLGKPHSAVVKKTISKLDKHCKAYIAKSPFVLVASSDNAGNFDISPKGDHSGFVHVLDDNTLVIPDRLGNRRADTFKNVLKNPAVGLLFLIPGKRETLRISGKAIIIKDEDILEKMTANGKIPNFCLAVEVKEAFFHCAKCVVRSNLWSPESWPTLDGLPSLADTMIDGGNLKMPKKILQAAIVSDEKFRL